MMRFAICVLLLSVLLLLTARSAAAQQNQRCFFQVEFVGDTGRQITTTGTTDVNYYAGGGVRFSCRGTAVRMSSDSVAALQGGKVVYFIGHVRYRDSTVTLDADRGTYFKDGERWEARGNVKTANLQSGSTLTGPSVDYFRQVAGIRDTAEVVAVGRTTVRYVAKVDSSESLQSRQASAKDEPYIIVGDRLRMRGEDRIWAAGKVTVNRSDLDAAADSMALDTGGGWQEGVLIGKRPSFKGMDRDTFELKGRRIDFGLDKRDLRVVTSIGDAEAKSSDRTLTAPVIRLHVRERAPRRSLAWGKGEQANADGPAYAAKADSLVFESPDRALTRVTAFGHGWVAARADSATKERDWVAGDTVIAQFRQLKGSTVLADLVARREARAYYRGGNDGKAKGSLAYVRGDLITITMQTDREEVKLVDVRGHVDGIQLEPKSKTSVPSPLAAPTGRR